MDVDECASGSACGLGATCRNVEGGYECACPAGSEGDPRVACREADACARAVCGRGALCQTLPGAGSYRCVCPPGFRGDPDVRCTGERRNPKRLFCPILTYSTPVWSNALWY